MESNKDEAERCLSIALKAIQSNQPDRALRFLEKALKLYPTPRVRGEREAPASPRRGPCECGGGTRGTDRREQLAGGGVAARHGACAVRRAGAAGRCGRAGRAESGRVGPGHGASAAPCHGRFPALQRPGRFRAIWPAAIARSFSQKALPAPRPPDSEPVAGLQLGCLG